MSESAASIEDCPACEAESVSYWEELEAWICDDCSYAVGQLSSETTIPEFSPDVDESPTDDQDWNRYVSARDKSEENLVEVLSHVEEFALPTELRAAEIVTEAWKQNFMHGRTKPDTVGASVYAASREAQQAIPPAAIADQLTSGRQSIKNTYRQLKSELQLDIAPPRPTEYLGHICRELDLPDEVETAAEKILVGTDTGGNPVGIAAAAVYVSVSTDGSDVTLRKAAAVTGLTKETIWRHASKLRNSG